jgi:hypothetical protein
MSELIIRPVRLDDAERVAELSGTLGYPVDAETMRERLARFLALDAHLIVVAESAGRVVGWTHGAEQELLEMDRVARSWVSSWRKTSAGLESGAGLSKPSRSGRASGA